MTSAATSFTTGCTVVLAGATASGKSALAMALAEALNSSGVRAVLINADSMQVYRDLQVLTARPDARDTARVPHRLYGVMPASERCSAARWRALARAEIKSIWDQGELPVVVGGTGLYIRALLDGIAAVPDIPTAVRQAAAAHFEALGAAAFHADLAAHDPVAGQRISIGDRQRMLRAWEVLQATGRPLSSWQEEDGEPGLSGPCLKILVDVARDELYRRADARFGAMLENGALEEVAGLSEAGLDADLPVMKALGVAALSAHLRGEIDHAAAADRVRRETRNFAKRQLTWFRHQYKPDATVSGEDAPAMCIAAVERFLLTAR